ncbi:hypothetical protein ACHAPQ_004621 [Fusarium lateritium]
MCCPVNSTQIQEDNEQSYCYAVDKVCVPDRSFAVGGNLSSITRSFEACIRGKYRRRQPKDRPQRKSSWGKGQVTKINTQALPGVDQDRENDLSVKDVFADPNPERNKYVHERISSTTEAVQVEELENSIRCLAVTLGDRPGRAVSPRIEEAYAQGESLTPPEIEFSEDSDMEEDYWTWDQETQRFRHWDGELGEYVCFPERFD